MVRFGDTAKYKYWGFSQMEQGEVDVILHSMQVSSLPNKIPISCLPVDAPNPRQLGTIKIDAEIYAEV